MNDTNGFVIENGVLVKYTGPGGDDVVIPRGVTDIGYNAFRRCKRLISVTIPDGVTSIGGAAFCYCTSLTSVTIPNSVTTIGEDAFRGCSNLSSVTIPSGVSIGRNAFLGCPISDTRTRKEIDRAWKKGNKREHCRRQQKCRPILGGSVGKCMIYNDVIEKHKGDQKSSE